MPSLLDEFGAPGQRRELRRVAAGEDHFHRVGVERHQHRRHTAGPARLHRVVDQLGVSAVNTVEHADGDDTSAPVRGDLVLAPPALHDGQAYDAPARRGCARSPDQVMIA